MAPKMASPKNSKRSLFSVASFRDERWHKADSYKATKPGVNPNKCCKAL